MGIYLASEMNQMMIFPSTESFVSTREHSERFTPAMACACLLSIVLAIYFLIIGNSCGSDCSGELPRILVISGHVIAMLGFGTIAMLLLRGNKAAALSPAFGLILCCAVFFGFGNLAPILADDETQLYMMRGDYYLEESQLIRADFQSFVGLATIYIFMILSFSRKYVHSWLHPRPVSLRISAMLFVFFGLTLKLALIVPAEWGYLDITVPGTLMNLQPLADVGFMLLAMAIARGDRKFVSLFFILWPLHFAVCILSFTKESMIVAVLLPIIGAALGGMNLRKTLLYSILVAVLFIFSQNAFLAARKDIASYSGTERQSPLADRTIILGRAFGRLSSGEDVIVDGSALPSQLWWARLSYAGPQIRAVELFDSGQRLPVIYSPLQVLVPRVLWPDKPELTNLGLMFNREISRNNETLGRVAFTIFGEGYWMFGWPGVFLFSGATGMIFGFMTRQSQEWLRHQEFIFLPAILLATKMGAIGVMGFFQTGIAIDFALFFVLAVVIKGASIFLAGRR